ncbi:hypothetical protein [Hymenobacter fodinae]|uniref:Uncharacterized protein n=1 Tax=Hymenobacter fodinae TaxID=2510796 RepID=A0A4Z0PB30_9BACT|nr:hypothetical protein [Hymenobacter fodinae]TGE09835.1 hypothetical protein EU556_03135 [Hymenobacter fodinae]
MNYELPNELIPVFEKHYQTALELLDAVIILDGRSSSKPNFWNRFKGRKSIRHFQKCLTLLPHHWPARWGMGKAYQGLGDHINALACFAEAYRLYPHNADVVREASIAAMEAGKPEDAVMYSAAALALSPTDAGLLCNHAINLLVAGRDQDAVKFIEQAMTLAPKDVINQNAQRLIQNVVSGKAKRPTCYDLSNR